MAKQTASHCKRDFGTTAITFGAGLAGGLILALYLINNPVTPSPSPIP